MTSFFIRMADEKRRLAILFKLSIESRFKMPLAALRDHLDLMGCAASLDRMRADAAWLEETGLVGYDREADVITLTSRGLDVAQGFSEVPGVGRPRPEA